MASAQSGFGHFAQKITQLERLLEPDSRTCGSVEIRGDGGRS